jgi:hypothetical protein
VASRPLNEFVDLKVNGGPAITQYEKAVKISLVVYELKWLGRSILGIWRHRLIPIARVIVKKLIRYDQRKQ